MADTGIVEIDGKRMKKCPGWEGNSYSCGRGNPRLIAEEAEVCENCSRGMRKRGQKTREEQEQAERKERERIARLDRGVATLEARIAPDVEAGKAAVAFVLRALDEMKEEDVDPATYWKGDALAPSSKMEILRHFAGVQEPEEKRRRGYYR